MKLSNLMRVKDSKLEIRRLNSEPSSENHMTPHRVFYRRLENLRLGHSFGIRHSAFGICHLALTSAADYPEARFEEVGELRAFALLLVLEVDVGVVR